MEYNTERSESLARYSRKVEAELLALAKKLIAESPEPLGKTANQTASDYLSDMCGDLFGLPLVETRNAEVIASQPYQFEPEEYIDPQFREDGQFGMGA